MTPEREDKLRRIVRLAGMLEEGEREGYVAAMTAGDPELKRAVEAYFARPPWEEQTLREPWRKHDQAERMRRAAAMLAALERRP